MRKSIRHQHSCNLLSNQRMVHKLNYPLVTFGAYWVGFGNYLTKNPSDGISGCTVKNRVVKWAENQIALVARLRTPFQIQIVLVVKLLSHYQNQIAIAKNCEKLRKIVIFSFWTWKSLKNLNFAISGFDENYYML